MSQTPDFQLGFAAGFKLGSDAPDYKKQIEDYRKAEAAAKEAQKASAAAFDRAQVATELQSATLTEFERMRAQWNAQRDAERKKLDDDADSLVALRMELTRREGELPLREGKVQSRENAISELERVANLKLEQAESAKRRYETLMASIGKLAEAESL